MTWADDRAKDQRPNDRKRCLDCGKDHDPRPFDTPLPENALELYQAKKYWCPAPPVETGVWKADSWMRWINLHGRWEQTEGKTETNEPSKKGSTEQ